MFGARRHNEEGPTSLTKGSGRVSPAKKKDVVGTRYRWIFGGTLAGVAVITIVAIVVSRPSAPKKKSLGLTIEPQCAGFVITDLVRLRDNLRKAIVKALKKDTVDPFALTSSFLKNFKCTVYPAAPRSPAEAELYVTIFQLVTELMEQEHLVSASQRATFESMAITWARSHGAMLVPADEEDDPIIFDEGDEPQS